MGSLVKLAEQLSSQFGVRNDPIQAAARLEEKENPKLVDYRTTRKEITVSKRPATKKQRGWIYYNLKLSTYNIDISRADMSVLIERSQRSKEEKAKVQFRLRQMGAKECK